MSKIRVSLKIDVSKIDKARLFSGQKGTYLDATVFIDIDLLDQYGNSGMITQDVSKEEKDSGVKGPILGNVQVFWRDDNNQPQQANNQAMNRQQAPQQRQQAPQQQQAPMQMSNQQANYQGQQAPQQQQQAPQQQQSNDDFIDDEIPF